MAGDRNVSGAPTDQCGSVAKTNAPNCQEIKPSNTKLTLTNTVHNYRPNIAVNDGSVQGVDRPGFKALVVESIRATTNSGVRTITGLKLQHHILLPRKPDK
jgi:hypothetical protein